MKDSLLRKNNFDFLRFCLASLVVFNHCYLIVGKEDPLALLSNGQVNFGSFAVECFFAISGYLIFISLNHSKTILNYIWKRLLRLFPGLFVLLVFSLIVIPFFYKGNGSIFKEITYWTYLPKNLTLYNVQYAVYNVFNGKAINISLWTLCYEFTMYMTLMVFYPIRKRKKVALYLLLFCISVSYYLSIFHPHIFGKYLHLLHMNSDDLYRLATYFLMGSLLSFVKLKDKKNVLISVVAVPFLGIAVYFRAYNFIAPILVPLCVLTFGVRCISKISHLGKYGDFSYGIYVYGFLVQQIVYQLLDVNIVTFFSVSLILTLILAYFSWHYVEKPALKYKNIV